MSGQRKQLPYTCEINVNLSLSLSQILAISGTQALIILQVHYR